MKPPLILRLTQAWLLLLVVGSLQPARPGPIHALHRELHWLAFAVAAFLLFALARTRRQAVWSAIAVFALGLSLEFTQHLLYRNPVEWWDFRDDSLAVLAAFAIYHLSRIHKPAAPPS